MVMQRFSPACANLREAGGEGNGKALNGEKFAVDGFCRGVKCEKRVRSLTARLRHTPKRDPSPGIKQRRRTQDDERMDQSGSIGQRSPIANHASLRWAGTFYGHFVDAAEV
jgi:hypothetical protein